MQPAPLDSLALADSVATADSLARVDSIAQAASDSSVVDITQGVGRLGRDLGDATDALAEGRFEVAIEGLLDAVTVFVWEGLLPAVLAGLFYYAGYRLAHGLLRRTMSRAKRIDAGIEQLVLRALRGAFLLFAAVAVLDELGIAAAPFIAGLGIAGVALGFAAQDTVQNLIAGVTILLDRPFVVGDNIELDDTFGTVEEITLRTTRVRTLDNQMAILPNANVISNKVINHSMLRALRVIVPFGIAYKESPSAARATVLALAEGDKRLHPDYAPSAVVTELGDSSVNMELRLHLRDPKLEVALRFEYQEKVFDALREAGIEIPFPHLQLFIDEAKAFEGTRLLGPGDPPPAA